jgi:hypothetical protein
MSWLRKRHSISSASSSVARRPAGAGTSTTKEQSSSTNMALRIGDKQPPPLLSDFAALAARTADAPIQLPQRLPAQTPKLATPRFTESSIYPTLETNIDSVPMAFSQEPIPDERSERSIALHGSDTPFRHWTVINKYIQSLVDRNGYQDLVSYNTTVEKVEKVGHEWKVVLRKEGAEKDYWWVEWFDAVIVASGHYSVPYVPSIEGLEQFEKTRPGSVIHSKQFRGKDYFAGKVSRPVNWPNAYEELTNDNFSVLLSLERLFRVPTSQLILSAQQSLPYML